MMRVPNIPPAESSTPVVLFAADTSLATVLVHSIFPTKFIVKSPIFTVVIIVFSVSPESVLVIVLDGIPINEAI